MTAVSNKPDDVSAEITTDEAGAKHLQLKAGRKVLATFPLTKKRADAIEEEITVLTARLALMPRAIRKMRAAQRKAASAAARSGANGEASKPAGGRRKDQAPVEAA